MEIWKEAIDFVTNTYNLTKDFPKSEIFGLVNQIQRCVVSIPSNIAEGVVKHSDKDTLRFLDIALGSLAELDTQVIIALNLGYITDDKGIQKQISKVQALLSGLIKYYKKQST